MEFHIYGPFNLIEKINDVAYMVGGYIMPFV